MTLRTRLTAAFLAVVVGPVLLGAVFVAATVTAVGRDRSVDRLELGASATRSAVAALCQQLHASAEAVSLYPAGQRAAVAAELVGRERVDAVRVVDAAGEASLVTAGAPALPWAGCAGPLPGDGSRGGTGPTGDSGGYRAIAAQVALPDRAGEVWAATRLDQAFVERLAAASGVAVTLVGTDRTEPVHSTDPAAGGSVEAALRLAPGEVAESAGGRWVRRLDPAGGQPLPLVLSAPGPDQAGLYGLLTALVVAAGLAAVIVAWRLARSTTEPLTELARATDRVAEGDLSVRVPVRGGDEAGRLAATFNRMTHRTQAYVQALTASRDQLRQQLTVLGDTLSSTHDLDRILRVILQTAVAATGARGGAVVLLDDDAERLAGHATGAAEPAEVAISVPVGSGLLGSVAATGESRRGRISRDGPAPHQDEPRCRTYVVVPISAPGGMAVHTAPWPAPPAVRGVLALYDRLGDDEFDDTDLIMLRTFASQAAVAVDNVRIHEEAQRLSLTDPLTGLWNYRSLRESLRREVERASRFDHPLAVLTLDLDRFKDINDAYGHPAGDAVLAEFARRLRSETREVDLAFRQGGEEFVVLLPETDARGAAVVAQRLGAEVRDEPVVVAPRGGGAPLPVRITVSIGIAVYPQHARTPQALLDAADDALYAAKAAGRDTHRVATVVPEPVAAAELTVRRGARIPADNLPQAGGSGGPGEPERGGDPGTGGAQPPRQVRGR